MATAERPAVSVYNEMTSKKTKSIRSWLLFGFVIPVLSELLAAFLIVNTTSGAYAEGFAYIVVLVILIIAIPISLIGNATLVPRHITDKKSYLSRGMILPALFIGVILIYYTGIWDKTIYPLFPRHIEKIQTAGGNRLDDNTLENYFTLHKYKGSGDEMKIIEDYAMEHFSVLSRECPNCVKMNVLYYFVPRELYDPIDDAVSRERAIAIFRHKSTEGNATIEKVER